MKYLSSPEPHTAYIGVSNDNQEVFFDLFKGAMESIGVQYCRMLDSDFSTQDKVFIEKADLILLAGGDVAKGWDVIQVKRLKDVVIKRYSEGAVLIGVSEGAIQLGLYAADANIGGEYRIFDTFQVIPYIIGVHEENKEWSDIKTFVETRILF